MSYASFGLSRPASAYAFITQEIRNRSNEHRDVVARAAQHLAIYLYTLRVANSCGAAVGVERTKVLEQARFVRPFSVFS